MRRLACVVLVSAAALPPGAAYGGDATFTPAPGSPLAGPTAAGDMVVGDFNRDGDQDLAVTGTGRQILIYVGGPDATFAAGTTLNVTGSSVYDLAVGDFNQDDDQDLAVVGFAGQAVVEIFTGTAGAGFSAPTTIPLPGAISVAVGDFNAQADSDDDLAIGIGDFGGGNRVQVLRGAAGAGFTNGSSTGVAGITGDVTVGQFDAAGWDDLAVLLSLSNQAQILNGSGSDSFIATGTVVGGSLMKAVAVGDFDLDGNEDVAIANRNSDNVIVHGGDGPDGAGFDPRGVQPTGQGPTDLALGDFNSDGEEDLALPASEDGALNVLLGGSGFTFGAPLSTAVGGQPGMVAVGDFDRDGNQDVALADEAGGGVHVLVGGGVPWSSGNLLGHGGAEGLAGELTSTQTLPAVWSGTMRLLRYGVDPTLAAAQRWEGGSNFISGGDANGSSSLTQIVDVSGSAAGIDPGTASARLSAALGGVRNTDASMGVTATFLDAAGAALGSFSLGPVTRVDRANRTILLRRAATQAVPAGTRSIAVRLDAVQPAPGLRNSAMADNVKLTLDAPAPPPPTDITPPETTIDKGPKARTEKEKAKIRYSANEPATFECRLRGDAKRLRRFRPCGNAKIKYKNLDPGKLRFQVRATDTAGNVDESPARLRWKVI